MENQGTIAKIEMKMSGPELSCLTPRTVLYYNKNATNVLHNASE